MRVAAILLHEHKYRYHFNVAFNLVLIGARFVALYGVVYLTAVIVPRLPREEHALRDYCGTRYTIYAAHTERLFSRLNT